MKKVKTHVTLPTTLKQEIEVLAADRGYTTSDLVSRLLERWLAKEKAENPDGKRATTFD